MAVLRAIHSVPKASAYVWKSLAVSLTKALPCLFDGILKVFLFHPTISSYVLLIVEQNSSPFRHPQLKFGDSAGRNA